MGLQAEEKDCINVSGTWDATQEWDASNCGGAISTERYTYELIQDGCIVTLKRKEQKGVQVEVRGNKIYWPKRKIPGRQAGSTVVLEAAVSEVDGNKAIGGRHWTWTKGTNSCSGTTSWIDIKQPTKQTQMPSTVPSPTQRDKITVDDLWADKYKGDGPVNNDYFMPFGNAEPALHEFSGNLTIASSKMSYRSIWARENVVLLPELKIHFFTYQDHLVPVERNKLLNNEKCNWCIVLAPGRIWSESGDKGYSRASFPFTLVHYKMSQTHNGLATFLFNDKHVSALRFQIVQESAPDAKFDAWGQTEMRYIPSPLSDRVTLTNNLPLNWHSEHLSIRGQSLSKPMIR